MTTLTRFGVDTEVEQRAALVSLFGELDHRVADYCEARMRSRLGGWKLTLVHGLPSVDDVFVPRFIEELFDWIDSADSVFPPPIPPRGNFASGR